MPCDTITTVGINLGKADLDLLVSALDDLKFNPRREGNMIYFGYGESYNRDTQEIRVKSPDKVAQIKQAYSVQVIKTQTEQFGWSLNEIAPFQYQVMKR